MSDSQATVGVKKVTLSIVVTKADGTVIDYGTVASSDPEEAAQVGGVVTIEEPPYIAIPKQLIRKAKKHFTKE